MATKMVCDRCLADIEGEAAYTAKRLAFNALYLRGVGSEAVGELPIELCSDCVSVVKREILNWSEMRRAMPRVVCIEDIGTISKKFAICKRQLAKSALQIAYCQLPIYLSQCMKSILVTKVFEPSSLEQKTR